MEHGTKMMNRLCDIQIGEVRVKWERKPGLTIEEYGSMSIF